MGEKEKLCQMLAFREIFEGNILLCERKHCAY